MEDKNKPVKVGEMKSTTIYRGKDRKLYRKITDDLEVYENGYWSKVKINSEFLIDFIAWEY